MTLKDQFFQLATYFLLISGPLNKKYERLKFEVKNFFFKLNGQSFASIKKVKQINCFIFLVFRF